MIIYCSRCGAKIEHKANQKPSFCFSCGRAISLLSKASSLPRDETTARQAPNEAFEIDLTDEEASSSTPFGIEVELLGSNEGYKIQDILGADAGLQDDKSNAKQKKDRPKKLTEKEQKQILDSIRREASSVSRQSTNQ